MRESLKTEVFISFKNTDFSGNLRMVMHYPNTYEAHPILFDAFEENGQELITINYKGWKIRPFICYDLRFPVWLRNTYKEGVFEYDLAILIANWPQPKAYIWNTLLSARAIENQAYFIGVNRVGIDHNKVPYIGETKIVNAKGRTAAELTGDKEDILEAEIDMESLVSFRNHFTHCFHASFM